MPYWWYLGEGAFDPWGLPMLLEDPMTHQPNSIGFVMFCPGGLFIYLFIRGRFWIFFWVLGSMLSSFSDFLLLCFSASLLFCFLLSLLLCFSCFCFLLFLLLCFSASLFSLLLCFCPSGPFYFYYSTFSSLQSCVFAALLPAPLLPVFAVSLFFIFFCFILFCLYPKWNPRETLGETQRNPKEILIKKPYMKL